MDIHQAHAVAADPSAHTPAEQHAALSTLSRALDRGESHALEAARQRMLNA